jgi:alpha-N-acetylglucosamine transferase
MKNGVFWDIKTQFVPHRKHYFSATESSRIMLCKILGFHGSDYEECRLLDCDSVWLQKDIALLVVPRSVERSASIVRMKESAS